jgi:hypothetical protein
VPGRRRQARGRNSLRLLALRCRTSVHFDGAFWGLKYAGRQPAHRYSQVADLPPHTTVMRAHLHSCTTSWVPRSALAPLQRDDTISYANAKMATRRGCVQRLGLPSLRELTDGDPVNRPFQFSPFDFPAWYSSSACDRLRADFGTRPIAADRGQGVTFRRRRHDLPRLPDRDGGLSALENSNGRQAPGDGICLPRRYRWPRRR